MPPTNIDKDEPAEEDAIDNIDKEEDAADEQDVEENGD